MNCGGNGSSCSTSTALQFGHGRIQLVCSSLRSRYLLSIPSWQRCHRGVGPRASVPAQPAARTRPARTVHGCGTSVSSLPRLLNLDTYGAEFPTWTPVSTSRGIWVKIAAAT